MIWIAYATPPLEDPVEIGRGDDPLGLLRKFSAQHPEGLSVHPAGSAPDRRKSELAAGAAIRVKPDEFQWVAQRARDLAFFARRRQARATLWPEW
jgi:hypothetical protein